MKLTEYDAGTLALNLAASNMSAEDKTNLLIILLDNQKIEALRELVWGKDIPSTTCPEYREHHEAIQEILDFIDEELLYDD